jgi:hypothetical protein
MLNRSIQLTRVHADIPTCKRWVHEDVVLDARFILNHYAMTYVRTYDPPTRLIDYSRSLSQITTPYFNSPKNI